MGFLSLFGRHTKNDVSDNLGFDLKSILDTAGLHEVPIGKLHLPTGRIVAGDPFLMSDNKPFKTRVTPGNYPVKLLIHKVGDNHYRVAFAKIQFSASEVTSWTLALTEDVTAEEIRSLKKGEYFGYGVDAGLGCFTDFETNSMFTAALDNFYKEDTKRNYYDDLLAQEFKMFSGQHPLSREIGDWNNHFPKKGGDHNVIMFASGWGDGYYATYWGSDSRGEIVELITDFQVVGGE